MASNSHAVIRPHFRLICTPAQQTQGEWLASLVETVQPNAGATVRVGWSVLRLQSFDGKLVLCEPDFDGNPFTDFRPSVSTTLEVLAAEKSLLDRAGCAPVTWRYDEKVVVRRGAFGESRIVAQRQPPKDGDSGWYVASADERVGTPRPEELEALWAYQLLQVRPELLAAFALPAGWIAVWDGPTLVALTDENDVAH